MGLTEIVTGKTRKVLYAIFAFIGVGFTATLAGFGAAGEELPMWLIVALAVFGSLAAAFGFTAGANVSPPAEVEPLDVVTVDFDGDLGEAILKAIRKQVKAGGGDPVMVLGDPGRKL